LGFKTPHGTFEELTGIDVRILMGYALIPKIPGNAGL